MSTCSTSMRAWRLGREKCLVLRGIRLTYAGGFTVGGDSSFDADFDEALSLAKSSLGGVSSLSLVMHTCSKVAGGVNVLGECDLIADFKPLAALIPSRAPHARTTTIICCVFVPPGRLRSGAGGGRG
eukprot:5073692-Prymnesium_polylepis.2